MYDMMIYTFAVCMTGIAGIRIMDHLFPSPTLPLAFCVVEWVVATLVAAYTYPLPSSMFPLF